MGILITCNICCLKYYVKLAKPILIHNHKFIIQITFHKCNLFLRMSYVFSYHYWLKFCLNREYINSKIQCLEDKTDSHIPSLQGTIVAIKKLDRDKIDLSRNQLVELKRVCKQHKTRNI